MTMQTLPASFGKGGSNLTDGTLAGVLKELQGLNSVILTGTTANTKIDVAALRTEDTIVSALVHIILGGAIVEDKANVTIQATKAFGTITYTGVGPSDAETFVVNGVTYTWKTTPTAVTHVKRYTAGDAPALANLAVATVNAINGYESRRLANGSGINQPAVVATSTAGVVTVTSVVDGLGNGVVLTGTTTVLAATGTGTASATLTPVTVVADNTCVISGVTFTAKVVPSPLPGAGGGTGVQFYTKAAALAFPGVAAATAGSDCATGQWLAQVINDYENAHFTLDVVATAHATTGVVTLVPRNPFAGNIITLTEGGTNVAVTGSGTLTSGTNTGGIKTSTDTSNKQIQLLWYNKQ